MSKDIPLSEDLKYWRAERPDEWTMDRFIRKATALEGLVSGYLTELSNLHDEIDRLKVHNTFVPKKFSSDYHFMDIGDMVIKLGKKAHTKTLKWLYNFEVGEVMNNHYIGGAYYQFSRPDENSYLIIKFDYMCKQEVGREIVTKDFLVQGIVDSIE